MHKQRRKRHHAGTPQRGDEEAARARDSFAAAFIDWLEAWKACRRRGCRRRHGCAGVPRQCFEAMVGAWSVDDRQLFQFAIRAFARGLSGADAVAHAQAQMQRAKEALAQYEAATARAAPVAPAPSAPPQPRVRSL